MKGSLYFLQKSLIFLPKANIYFKFEEIKVVEFHRVILEKYNFKRYRYYMINNYLDWI